MYQKTDTTIITALNKQLIQLSKLANDVNQILHDHKADLPDKVSSNLADLTDQLIKVAQQLAEREGQRTNLLALADIGQVINSSLDTDQVLQIVMDTIVRLTGAERGFLMLVDEDGELATRLARNWEQESLEKDDEKLSRTIVNKVVTEGKPLLSTNAQEDPRFDGQESIAAYQLRSVLCVPFKSKEEVIGVIYADNRVRTGLFTTADRDLLVAFANQAAVAIENARLFESLRRALAETTELKNLMDNVFSSIASGVITTDLDEKIVLVNKMAEQILGYPAGQVLGKLFNESASPVTSYISPVLSTVLKEDRAVVGLEINPTLPVRGEMDLRCSISPLKDAESHTQGVAIVLDDLTEQHRLEAQRRLFGKMVSPLIIDQLDPDQLSLGGKRCQITCLFADIRGFTTFSERFEPEELVSILNRYLAAAADAVLAQQGTIDKYMGDAIMAWFNAPIPQPDHTLRAVKSALSIRESFAELRMELPSEAHLYFGVGIHFGEAVLGLVGSEKRIDYTAIGDSINTAKRIQENADQGHILISEAAYQNIKREVVAFPVDPILAKGKSKPIQVYQIDNISG